MKSQKVADKLAAIRQLLRGMRKSEQIIVLETAAASVRQQAHDDSALFQERVEQAARDLD